MTVLGGGQHESFRPVAKVLLEFEGYEVVGEAEDGLSGIEAARRLAPDMVLLDVQLPDIDGFDVAARLPADAGALEFRFRTEFELDANWKIACENFLECYHCAVAHPGFTAAVDVAPDSYRLDAAGPPSSQLGPLRQTGASFLAQGEVERSQFHFLWPNFGINVFPGRPNLSCGPIL